MTEQHAGIQFNETMAGGFALGVSDPQEGIQQGKRAGTALAIHVTVRIDDMQRFIAEASHPGGLSGTVDFTPWGKAIPSHSGVFNLFSPTQDPTLKLMVYELGFEYQGQDYYLAGRKEVRNDPLFDLWSDTTTLFTQLHQGQDKTGTVIGAGTLSLGVTDLIKLVSTLTVTNASATTDKIQTVGKFGKFFLGELWDTYVVHSKL